jgi:CRISPR/Cas system type I-B associated protein Csh2 (Cas7 group RAMP superfamily)
MSLYVFDGIMEKIAKNFMGVSVDDAGNLNRAIVELSNIGARRHDANIRRIHIYIYICGVGAKQTG